MLTIWVLTHGKAVVPHLVPAKGGCGAFQLDPLPTLPRRRQASYGLAHHRQGRFAATSHAEPYTNDNFHRGLAVKFWAGEGESLTVSLIFAREEGWRRLAR